MKVITILLILVSGSLLTSIIVFSILLHNSNNKLKKCNKEIENIKSKKNDIMNNKTSLNDYIYYNGMDLYRKNDLLDEDKLQIVIYTKDTSVCSDTCNKMDNCHGFSKYNNFCYLKNKFNESDIEQSMYVNLYKKK